MESERIWLEAEGYAHHYQLWRRLLTGYRGEGAWPPAVVPALLQAIASLQVF